MASQHEQEEAYDKILTASLQRIVEFLKYAEAKNGALLTLASFWALASINLLASRSLYPDDLARAQQFRAEAASSPERQEALRRRQKKVSGS